MKVAIYSAIYGKYEATAKPLPADLDVPAVMFTDNAAIAEQAPSAGWTVVFDESPYGKFTADPANGDPAIVTPMLAHKWWKTHPFEAMRAAELDDVDASIWLDGNMRIVESGAEWVARNVAALGNDEWSLMRHPWRECIYTEEAFTAAACWGRYSVEAMARQVAAYRSEWAHPEGWGLFASGHMVRRHTFNVIHLSHLWWKHNVKYSHQDQLSLPVLIRTGEQRADPLRWNANLPWATWALDPHGA